MGPLPYLSEPTVDLCYSSLEKDETERAHISTTIPKAERFAKLAVNGNLRVAVPDIDNEEVRKHLSPQYQVNTSTRTIFNNDMYDTHMAIADHLASPKFKFEAFKFEGHKPMNCFSPKDPRLHHQKLPYRKGIGPGAYEVDPTNAGGTGTLVMQPGEVHKSVNLAKDPTRASACFASPERGRTAKEIAEASVRPASTGRMQGPDFASWTERGFFLPRQPRVIESERWGATTREPRPPAKEQFQSFYDTNCTASGQPSSCEAYLSNPMSPSYKTAFGSGMPRLVALPAHLRQDTRVYAKSHEELSNTATSVGPGSYSTEVTRLRSNNINFSECPVYHSMGSDRDGFRPPDLGSRGLPPGTSTSPRAALTPLSLGSPRRQGAGGGDQLASPGSVGGASRHSSPTRASGAAGDGRALSEAEPGSPGSPNRVASAPAFALYPPKAKANKFGQLMFLRRAVPYKTMITSHLKVAADLKEARRKFRTQLASQQQQ